MSCPTILGVEMQASGVQGQSPCWEVRGETPPPKAHSILRIFCCQTMYNFVYLAKLTKHEKKLVSAAESLSSSHRRSFRGGLSPSGVLLKMEVGRGEGPEGTLLIYDQ